MKLVAVSQRIDIYQNVGEVRDGLDQRLTAFLYAAGALSVPVPNFLADDKIAWLKAISPDAIVLSGGNTPGTRSDRDATDEFLLDYAYRESLPVLGICRGMQSIGLWAGCDLIEVAEHVRTRHSISGELHGQVNSYHNFALETCPPDFNHMAYSGAGVIEAIKHKNLKWEGWMWHPEREQTFSRLDIARLGALIQ